MAGWRPSPADARAGRPVWLLDLEWGGRTWRMSTEPARVTDRSGVVHSYEGGLVLSSVEDAISPTSTEQPAASVSFELYLPDAAGPIILAGHDPFGAAASVWQVLVDRTGASLHTMEQRWHLTTGRIRGIMHSLPGRNAGYISGTVEGSTWASRERVIPAHYIDATAWPDSVALETEGKVYPLVIGTPGAYPDSGGTSLTPATPAYPVEYSLSPTVGYVLLAGHPVRATTVTLYDEALFAESFAVENVADGRGRIVAVADISGGTASFTKTDTTYWAAWEGATESRGGLVDYFGTGPLERIGRVAIVALLRGATNADMLRWWAVDALLPAWKVATYLNDLALDTAEWLVQELLPESPIAIRSGPDGWYPVITDPEVARGIQQHTITASSDFQRVDGPECLTERDEVITAISVSSAYDAEDKRYMVTETAGSLLDGDTHATLNTESSRTRTERTTIALELEWVYDGPTALSIALSKLRRECLPRWRVTVSAAPAYGWLASGDWFPFTDASCGWSERLCQVISRDWSEGRWFFELLHYEEPRDR